jgi:glucose/arabinose dehydrogenase
MVKPVTITNAGDDRLFVIEQDGRIRIIELSGEVRIAPFLDITGKVSKGTEQGLLGLAFHPDYQVNGFFYVDYTGLDNNTYISRFKVSEDDPDIADPASEFPVLSFTQPFTNHNGGDIKFGPDGYLYIAAGDGGSAGDPNGNGQDTTAMLGKLLRIDIGHGDPYTIPPANPFAGSKPGLDEIWAFGLRNPWRFSFDRETNDLWIADVGQDKYEEIDFQPALSAGGENYGWRCYEGDHSYNTTDCLPTGNYVSPVAEYGHTAGRCSVTGGYVYRGSKYPGMAGYYFYADYCTDELWSLHSNGDSWDVMYHGKYSGNNFSTFGEDRDGELYIAGLSTGVIYVVQDTSGVDAVSFSPNDGDILVYPNPFRGELFFDLTRQDTDLRQVTIYNVYGREVFIASELKNEGYLNLEFLPGGVYMIELKTDRFSQSREIVKL